VTVDNTSPQFPASGTFDTPRAVAGPAQPDEMFDFTFTAQEGQRLSFAAMMAQSNDLFYAPNGDGIDLFPGGVPLNEEVTSQVYLWDAGTEVNQQPGVGSDQAPRQSGPNTGAVENGNVLLVNDSYTYPPTSDLINVTVDHALVGGMHEFTVKLINVSMDALSTPSGDVSVPISPGVWVVHTSPNPLFTSGLPDYGLGLERIAEDGNPADLGMYLQDNTGLAVPLSPGIVVVHSQAAPLFAEDQPNYGNGLESLAEDGDPSNLLSSTSTLNGVSYAAVFDTPYGTTTAGPAVPGQRFVFNFNAQSGNRLSFATMFAQSNDLFFAPGSAGIDLFPNGTPISGDITSMIYLWDAGTEVNEEPGYGPNQAPRQSGKNTGTDENGTVQRISNVNDGFTYPTVQSTLHVSITAASVQ
jgi:hypothetical protein